jgi:hypothetical protein
MCLITKNVLWTLSIADQTVEWSTSGQMQRHVRSEANMHVPRHVMVVFELRDVALDGWLRGASELRIERRGSVRSVHLMPLR